MGRFYRRTLTVRGGSARSTFLSENGQAALSWGGTVFCDFNIPWLEGEVRTGRQSAEIVESLTMSLI